MIMNDGASSRGPVKLRIRGERYRVDVFADSEGMARTLAAKYEHDTFGARSPVGLEVVEPYGGKRRGVYRVLMDTERGPVYLAKSAGYAD